MIQLEKGNPPPALTHEEEQRLADEYEANERKIVWKKHDIPNALLGTSFGKCAYCENELNIGSMYCEVEHFECKTKYKRKVATWDNLLPSCSSCNSSKWTHDVVKEPILNPYRDSPSGHFILKDYRYHGLSEKGKLSQQVLGLNKSNQRLARFKVGDALLDAISNCLDHLETYQGSHKTQHKQKVINLMDDILRQCQKDTSFSAMCASILHTNSEYKTIYLEMKKLKIWTSELQCLHDQSFAIALIE